MIGPSLDIDLELDAVQPANLFVESLSPDSNNEEEEEPYYTLETSCTCGTVVRLMLQASHQTIRNLQVLLLSDLKIVCPLCAQIIIEHGRQ